MPKIPTEWTEPECWVWERIAAGEPANFNVRDRDSKNLDPGNEKGWGEDRRLSAKFLQTIVTQKAFMESTPYSGVQILGALIDDAPLILEHARLQHLFWLENSRILIDVRFRNLRVDGRLSLANCFVAAKTDISEVDIQQSLFLHGATFNGGLHLSSAKIGSVLYMDGSTIKGDVSLSSATVSGHVFLRNGATFNGGLNLSSAKIGSNLEMDGSTFEGDVNLNSATVGGSVFLRNGATFKGKLDLTLVTIGSNLEMHGATFKGDVDLNSATMDGLALFHNGATFKGKLDLTLVTIGSNLEMSGSTFEGDVSLNSATVSGNVFLRDGATVKGGLDLRGAKIASVLDMSGSTFEGDVDLNSATVDGSVFLRNGATFKGGFDLPLVTIGSNLEMIGSTFEGDVNLNSATVSGNVFLRGGATFKGGLDLRAAKIASVLDMHGSIFEGAVDFTGCTITGFFLLGFSVGTAARWGDDASLTLGNSHVGELQDWWRDENTNSWPKTYQLEGFTYDRLGSMGAGKESIMMKRPVTSYIDWLNGDPGSSPQPYEHLAHRFHEAGEPHKAADILYAARERRRRQAWSTTKDDHGKPKWWFWLPALGLSALQVTIGYGLGYRYFRVLWWVGGLTLVGTFVLIFFGAYRFEHWWHIFFASLDQLLPIITLDKAHDILIFGDPSAKPHPVTPQPYGVLVYFYAHKILGWVLGSFLVAGLAGLTQRN